MPSWYEVFDNVEVQYKTRKKVAVLSALATGAVAVSFAVLALGYLGSLTMPLVGGALLVLWLSGTWWMAHRLQKLRQVVWCVKLSDREVVGYDYARRKVRIDWTNVDRIALMANGLLIADLNGCSIQVPYLFPDFPALSHRVIHYADFYSLPVYVDGQPWQQLNVYDLYPFLAEAPSTHDTTRGPAQA